MPRITTGSWQQAEGNVFVYYYVYTYNTIQYVSRNIYKFVTQRLGSISALPKELNVTLIFKVVFPQKDVAECLVQYILQDTIYFCKMEKCAALYVD